MTLFCRLSRRHYWCTPHRSEDNRLVQVCYECGSERPARELHDEPGFFGVRNVRDQVAPRESEGLTSMKAIPMSQRLGAARQSMTEGATLGRLTLVK